MTSLILTSALVAAIFGFLGYLTGFRRGQESADLASYRKNESLQKCVDSLRRRVDFLLSENDAWQRRYKDVVLASTPLIKEIPPVKLTATEAARLGLAGPIAAISEENAERVKRQVLLATQNPNKGDMH